jgi:hypothetical protein
MIPSEIVTWRWMITVILGARCWPNNKLTHDPFITFLLPGLTTKGRYA